MLAQSLAQKSFLVLGVSWAKTPLSRKAREWGESIARFVLGHLLRRNPQ
jgi:hypothetical protein